MVLIRDYHILPTIYRGNAKISRLLAPLEVGHELNTVAKSRVLRLPVCKCISVTNSWQLLLASPDPDPHQLKIRIRIRIKGLSWTRISLQMTSQNVWNRSLFEHFFQGFLILYLEARICIC